MKECGVCVGGRKIFCIQGPKPATLLSPETRIGASSLLPARYHHPRPHQRRPRVGLTSPVVVCEWQGRRPMADPASWLGGGGLLASRAGAGQPHSAAGAGGAPLAKGGGAAGGGRGCPLLGRLGSSPVMLTLEQRTGNSDARTGRALSRGRRRAPAGGGGRGW